MTSTATLGEIVDEYGGLIQTGPFGSQLHQSDYADDGVPVVMPKDIRGGRVDESDIARIPEPKARALSRHILKPGSIVFPRRGEISKCAHIDAAQAGFLCGTGCIKIEPPEDKLRSRFLYYYLGLRQVVEWLERNAVGTTMLNLSTKILGGVRVPLCPPRTQDSIISILSAYDDLIENNQRRIQLLEQAARLLYKEWFVHLHFPGHERVKIKDGIPEGWERKNVGNVAPLQYGRSLKKENRVPGLYPVYGSSGVVGTHEKAWVTGPAIIVGRKGNVGSVFWSTCDFHPIDTVYYIKSEHCTTYLYYTLLNTQFINTDVAVPGLNRDFAHSRELLIPGATILALFEEHTTAIRDQIDRLTKYSDALSLARNLLLPRLMSGEMSID